MKIAEFLSIFLYTYENYKPMNGFFYVLLTVHLSIILAINQLNAQSLLL